MVDEEVGGLQRQESGGDAHHHHGDRLHEEEEEESDSKQQGRCVVAMAKKPTCVARRAPRNGLKNSKPWTRLPPPSAQGGNISHQQPSLSANVSRMCNRLDKVSAQLS
jgi:hypothetical protein